MFMRRVHRDAQVLIDTEMGNGPRVRWEMRPNDWEMFPAGNER